MIEKIKQFVIVPVNTLLSPQKAFSTKKGISPLTALLWMLIAGFAPAIAILWPSLIFSIDYLLVDLIFFAIYGGFPAVLVFALSVLLFIPAKLMAGKSGFWKQAGLMASYCAPLYVLFWIVLFLAGKIAPIFSAGSLWVLVAVYLLFVLAYAGYTYLLAKKAHKLDPKGAALATIAPTALLLLFAYFFVGVVLFQQSHLNFVDYCEPRK